MPISEVHNMDCMEGMKQYDDNHFELAIVDPPYGIGFGEFNRTNKDSNGVRYKANKYKNEKWDSGIPTDGYFEQLLRVSKHQIVWGGNYFPYLSKKPSEGFKTINEFNEYINNSPENWCFWYKQNPVSNFADGELAWTSFDYNTQVDIRYYGNLEGNTSASKKYHPTQKPVQLYEWLLMNYAKEGDKILDTHLGSGSSRIAAYNLSYDFTGYELDKDYFDASVKRFEQVTSQTRLFT